MQPEPEAGKFFMGGSTEVAFVPFIRWPGFESQRSSVGGSHQKISKRSELANAKTSSQVEP